MKHKFKLQNLQSCIILFILFISSIALADISINDLPGQYVRQPPTNSWHTGTISITGESLQWENEAGITWPLIPDLENEKLSTSEECPYYNSNNGDAFSIVLKQNDDGSAEVEGFLFLGELYTRQTEQISIDDVLGKYVRKPPSNSWHSGTISMVDNSLQWENEAGVSWPLFENLENEKLLTDEECPYYEVNGGDAFIIISGQNNTIEGFQFLGELYSKETSSNNVPIGHNQTVSTNKDTSVSIQLTGSDADGDLLTYQVESNPQHGILSGTAPYLSYMPDSGYEGSDSFTFTVSDGQLTSSAATISLNIGDNDNDDIILSVSEGRHLLVTKLSPVNGDSKDLDFLAMIPAATAITNGEPAILAAVNDTDFTNSLYFSDYLSKYQPVNTYTINAANVNVPTDGDIFNVDALSGIKTAREIALHFWEKSTLLVVADPEDYSSASQASALAARLGVPLVFSDGTDTEDLEAVANDLQTIELITVGSVDINSGLQTTSLPTTDAVIKWLDSKDMRTDYFAMTNTSDLNISDAPKLSLLAPMLAARREGVVVPLTDTSSPEVITQELRDLYQSVGYHPEYLAIVGSAGAIPLEIMTDPVWPDLEIASDISYSQTDDDLFPDLAIGRIVANNVMEGTLFVSRTSTYDSLLDGIWEESFAEVGSWSKEIVAPMLRNYGFSDPVDLVNKNLSNYPEIESSVIVHYGHSNEVYMGDAFGTGSTNVLAPNVVMSRGCSVAGIDKNSSHRSIVKHLFKLGSVGFVGAPRNATTIGTQIQLAFFNKILEGEPLGKAYQHGVKSLTLTWMIANQNSAKRERSNMMFLGDPALVIHIPQNPVIEPVRTSVTGNQIEITIPETDWVSPLDSLLTEEWGYDGVLYLATIPGVEATTYWGSGGYDHEDHYFMAEFDTSWDVLSVTQNETFTSPLGMRGSYFVDSHQNGSKTILWHVRVLDFDQTTAIKNGVIDKVSYTLEN